jgi:CBS domain-containing protein
MPTIRDIIRLKENQKIYSISQNATVYEALQLLAEKNIGAVLVMTAEHIDGIISERDCVRKVELMGKTAREVRVGDIMTSHVLSMDINQSLEECMKMMTENNIRHLPVFENQKLVGVISIRDVLKEIVSDQRFMIDQLSRYISGAGR